MTLKREVEDLAALGEAPHAMLATTVLTATVLTHDDTTRPAHGDVIRALHVVQIGGLEDQDEFPLASQAGTLSLETSSTRSGSRP